MQTGRKKRREWQQDVPSYNIRDVDGYSPVFRTSSSKIVEVMLKFGDLQVTRWDGIPLLWWCASEGLVSERVALDPKLAGQYGQRWEGSLPLERGKNEYIVI